MNLKLAWFAAFCAVLTPSIRAQCADAILAAPDKASPFAYSVAADAGRLVSAGRISGEQSLFSFEIVGNEWLLQQTLPPDLVGPKTVRTLALQGERLLASSFSQSWVRVFEHGPNQWEAAGTLNAIGTHSSDFGKALALADDFAFVGDPGEGSVSIYRLQGSSWLPHGKIVGPMVFTFDSLFGYSLAVRGDRLLVGAPGNRRAYFYAWDGADWQFTQDVLNPLPTAFGSLEVHFGASVALQEDFALVAVPNYQNRGAIVEFELSPSTGSWEAVDQLEGAELLSTFGSRMDVEGERLIVGLPSEGPGGLVEVYERGAVGPGAWELIETLTPLGPELTRFGEQVVIDADTYVVGDYDDPVFGPLGTAQIFGPGTCALALDEVSPAVLVGFQPPSNEAPLTLTGDAFWLIDEVAVGGVSYALDSQEVSVESSQRLVVSLPLPATPGIVEVEISGPTDSLSTRIEILPAAPYLDFSNPLVNVFSGTPFALTLAGTPGSVAVVFVSPSDAPSAIPGVLDLGIADNFTSLFVLGSAPMPPEGWIEQDFTVHSASGELLFLELFFQAVEVSSAPPFAASQVDSAFWVF